jgi:hypothetical protein
MVVSKAGKRAAAMLGKFTKEVIENKEDLQSFIKQVLILAMWLFTQLWPGDQVGLASAGSCHMGSPVLVQPFP